MDHSLKFWSLETDKIKKVANWMLCSTWNLFGFKEFPFKTVFSLWLFSVVFKKRIIISLTLTWDVLWKQYIHDHSSCSGDKGVSYTQFWKLENVSPSLHSMKQVFKNLRMYSFFSSAGWGSRSFWGLGIIRYLLPVVCENFNINRKSFWQKFFPSNNFPRSISKRSWQDFCPTKLSPLRYILNLWVI